MFSKGGIPDGSAVPEWMTGVYALRHTWGSLIQGPDFLVWQYSWGDVDKCLLTPDREATTDQSQIWWTIEFHWGCLQECGWWVIYSALKTVTSITKCPPQHGGQIMKTGNLKCTVQHRGCSTGWRLSFPGDSVYLSFFQVAQQISASCRWYCVVWASSRQLTSPKNFLGGVLPAPKHFERKGLSESGKFQGFPEAFELFTSWE